MARPKRPPHPLLQVAREYLINNIPELQDIPLHLHHLDGPPGAPRYAITAELCHHHHNCPFGMTFDTAESGRCPILSCVLRHSIRLLFNREGELIQTTKSGVRWQ